MTTLTPTRLALLAAVNNGEVTGEASRWWRDGWAVVSNGVECLQAARLVEQATPPPVGRITARITAAGVAALDGAR